MAIQRQYALRLEQKLAQKPDNPYLKHMGSITAPDLESRILVEIPAYRDPELVPTMQAALAMAANPERVCFAVCYQGDDDEEAGRVAGFPRTKVKRFTESEAPGLCAARYEASRLWSGEEYVLHVDSHMRFASFWDVCVIDQYNRCPGDRKVLTEYNIDFMDGISEPVDSGWFDDHARIECKKVGFCYFQDGTHKARFTGKSGYPGPEPQQGAFMGGHFLFGRPEMDLDVPSDPETFFVADEACVAMRLWTHGYNIWHPGVRFVFHLYNRSKVAEKAGNKLQRFAAGKASSQRSANEHDRMLKLFLDGRSQELGQFGLGAARTAGEYYRYAGVDYRSRMVRNFALHGRIHMEHSNRDMAPACLAGDLLDEKHDMHGTDLDGAHSDVFFVIVTAYKAKKELAETVRSLYGNADNPERVRVCVVAQLTDEEWLDQARALGAQVVPCEPKGAGHAHYVGEERIPEDAAYVLYSEEHMYYAYGWDTAIACYMRYAGSRAVLSDWAFGFDYDKPYPIHPSTGCIICAGSMLRCGHIHIRFGRTFGLKRPVRGAFLVGHNLVVPADVAREVRHSPDMYLNTNESYMSYRYWCAGVDVYHAPLRYCFHYWKTSRNGSGDGTSGMENSFSMPRMQHLLGLPGGDAGADTRFALGSRRTLKSFAAFSGADPFTGTCSVRAQVGMFADDFGTDVIPDKLDGRADGSRWAAEASALRWHVDFDKAMKMDRRALEALCGPNGPMLGISRDGGFQSYGGQLFGMAGAKLSVRGSARVVLHGDSRLFVLGDVVLGDGCFLEVHPGADLVLGPGNLTAGTVVDCWKRVNLVDFIADMNSFISDGYALEAHAADGRRLLGDSAVSVGPHAWLGAGAAVLPGTSLKDAVAGAMAAVGGAVPAGAVAVGNPVRIAKEGCHWHG